MTEAFLLDNIIVHHNPLPPVITLYTEGAILLIKDAKLMQSKTMNAGTNK